MKKFISIFAILAIVLVGGVFAHQNFAQNSQGFMATQSGYERGTFHEDVESVLENGTYEDLVTLRDELGFDVMRRVQSQEDFNEMQEMHELMEEQGYEPGYMRQNSQRGTGFGGGCHRSN